ncbi:right-handed parallel beta-helix repeat-containing protein [Algoriphagus sp. D3-2-R+10]|uniref:right-handed parallel beta-helix repeat-containing protein n=1 Tax=Algoriphagus aurantiacus TaxID=3103948 RepID=UPI002B3752C8|nr:right-handed parallel beta-helix repeat-containing protein [Algoriphagus sp. D3-2-R+10]MEB2776069.1 right-handed parallel beta-helix repeat-containing protein [Algoriphagus sp. D3-2-R+10]
MLRKPFIIVLLLLICASGRASTYYFSSSDGDDKRSLQEAQNPETPWESIQKLNTLLNIIRPGDSILFKNDDRFHGTINIVKSGTVKSPVYFGKYGSGENPTLTGFCEITNWISKGDNLFESHIPEMESPLSTVIINDKIYPLGRYPNENEYDGGYFKISAYKEGHIESSNFKTSANYAGGEIVIRKNNWIIDRHTISTNTGNSIDYLDFEKEIAPMIGYGFFIQNHPSTLDQHGEWYFDTNSKKLLIYHEGNPIDEDIKAVTLSEVISIQNTANNISFENINIEGSNKNLISLKGSSNIIFQNCNLAYIGQNAIDAVSTKNITISNSTIKNSLNGGVFLGWNDIGLVIKNSTFENIFNFAGMGKNGEMQSQAIYMSEKTSNVLIEENKFFKCGYNGINFSGDNINIKNNLIDTFCFIKDDGGGIYTFTGPSKTPFINRKIIGNIIINGIGAVAGTKPYGINDLPYVEGIYLDTFVSEVDIENNTIANIKGKGIFLNNADHINIINNKIVNTGYSIYLKSDDLDDSSENIVVQNNEFLATTASQIHYYIRTNFDELSKIGEFDKNILFRPLSNSKTIFLQTPKINGLIDVSAWNTKFNLDKNSSIGQVNTLNINPSERKTSKLDSSLLLEYNHSRNPKSISLLGTYVDIRGNRSIEKIEIPPYSSIVLLKSRNEP